MAKKIKLREGYYATIDDKDFEEVSKFSWRLKIHKKRNILYAYRNEYKNKKYHTYLMHRHILNVSNPKIFVDHKDHDGLNNCRSNIRICSNQENQRNRKSQINSTSKFLGVHLRKNRPSPFVAKICVNGKNIHIGCFKNELDAAMAYDNKARELFGEFANINLKNL